MSALQIMFLDESDNHGLTQIDPEYPVFVLGGVIVERAYAEGPLEERLRAFKREVFERDDLILHTADLTGDAHGSVAQAR